MPGADEPLYDCRVTVYEPRVGGEGGVLPYKSDRDARRLA